MDNIPELPLEPPEPRQLGCCLWCGEEIYEDNAIFTGEGGMVHRACMAPMACDILDPEELAALCGYREEFP